MSLAEMHEMLDRIARETWHASETGPDRQREILEQVSLYAETAKGLLSTLTVAQPSDTTPAPAELN